MNAADTIKARFQCAFPGFDLDVDLTLAASGITALFGPSGCGKTTLLRCMAGLQDARGLMTVAGDPWQTPDFSRPVHSRSLAYVFQETHLFPHLSVRGNLEFGYRRIPAGQRQIGFDDAVHWLGLQAHLDRMPSGLSGGERQRVAIARALLTSPKLLLMDEPLSSLDQGSKQDILPYLEQLRDQLAIPIIYVTHCTGEVARLADQIVVMDAGRVKAQGPLGDTLARADNPFSVTDDAGILLEGIIVELDEPWHLALFRFDGGQLWLRSGAGVKPGDRVRVQVMARDISLALSANPDQSSEELLPATIDQVTMDITPGISMVRLLAGPTPFLARLTSRAVTKLDLKPGGAVWMQVRAATLVK